MGSSPKRQCSGREKRFGYMEWLSHSRVGTGRRSQSILKARELSAISPSAVSAVRFDRSSDATRQSTRKTALKPSSGPTISSLFFSLRIVQNDGPIERFWQFLKGLWKGENFVSLDALRQRVTQELEQLSLQQVQSLTSFDFILEALLQAAF